MMDVLTDNHYLRTHAEEAKRLSNISDSTVEADDESGFDYLKYTTALYIKRTRRLLMVFFSV